MPTSTNIATTIAEQAAPDGNYKPSIFKPSQSVFQEATLSSRSTSYSNTSPETSSTNQYNDILEKQLQEYKDLQERYEKQRKLYEQDKENFDIEFHKISDLYNSTKQNSASFQPIQQLSVTNRATNQTHKIELVPSYEPNREQGQRPKSADRSKKLRKKKSVSQSKKILSTNTSILSNASRRHSISGTFGKSKRVLM
jgi:hypothetical protein